jgi:hypothetical protein
MSTAVVTLIGYLVPLVTKPGVVVWCDKCANGKNVDPTMAQRFIPLYRENVGKYKQSCHICGETMVEQDKPTWMMLARQLYPNLIPALPKLNQDGGLSPQIPSNNEPRP